MSDENTSLAAHVGTVASATTAIGRSTQDSHGTSKCNSIINKKRHEVAHSCATTSTCIGPSTLSKDKIAVAATNNDYNNECEQVDSTVTIPMTTTTTAIVRRPNLSPTVPSIAVTSVAADASVATIAPTPITSTTKRTCKRTGKIDFVRFDSVETVFNQADHDEVILRATIKDEIKR